MYDLAGFIKVVNIFKEYSGKMKNKHIEYIAKCSHYIYITSFNHGSITFAILYNFLFTEKNYDLFNHKLMKYLNEPYLKRVNPTKTKVKRTHLNQGEPHLNQGEPYLNQGEPYFNQGEPNKNQSEPYLNQFEPYLAHGGP